MLVALTFTLGAVFGWTRAARRGGDRLDKLQYAVVHGLIAALVTLILWVIVQWFTF